MSIQSLLNLLQLNLLVAIAYFQFKTNELLLISNAQTMELKIQLLKQEQKMEVLFLKNDALSAKLGLISSTSSTDSQFLTWVVLGGVLSIIFLLVIKSDEDALIQFAQMIKKNTEEVLSSQEAIRQSVDHVLEAVIPSVTSEAFKSLPCKSDMAVIDELIKAAMG